MAPSARATAMAIELDRLLGARDDASGTRAVRSVEHAPDVSRAALFGTTRGDENASRMPDAFYACGDALRPRMPPGVQKKKVEVAKGRVLHAQ